ncbi:hypothetical protein V6N11_020249 [Hibiscus sabdariffa]|uniref:Uncharacterized protein n=1 Tax=Hibiscus sabdariffa TaxID=183260 RepID=A0ABR2Q8C5_9ROSI
MRRKANKSTNREVPMSLCMDLQQWDFRLHLLIHLSNDFPGFCWLCNSPSSLIVKTVWEKAWCCLVQRQ